MSKRLPVELNIPRLAGNNACLQGVIKLSQFKRLADCLYEPCDTDLDLELRFSNSPAPMRFSVSGWFFGEVKLECHRCGQAMNFKLDGSFNFAMIRTEGEADHIDELYEPVVMDEFDKIYSTDLLEDELILHIPIAPRHPDEEHCIGMDYLSNTDDKRLGNPSPFLMC